jgi:leader peptidase (prepilin peptidase)/N-methyltransferase
MDSSAVAATIPRSADLRLGARASRSVVVLAPVAAALPLARFGLSADGFIGALFAVVLVYIAVFDLEHRLIPNRVVLPATAAVLALQIGAHPDRALEHAGAALGAAGFFFAVALIYPPGLGMGDVKLALLLGAMLGTAVVGAILVATIAAGVVGAVLMLRYGAKARKRAIPFGPFLALGGMIALLLS